jgi:hypothetical protein
MQYLYCKELFNRLHYISTNKGFIMNQVEYKTFKDIQFDFFDLNRAIRQSNQKNYHLIETRINMI